MLERNASRKSLLTLLVALALAGCAERELPEAQADCALPPPPSGRLVELVERVRLDGLTLAGEPYGCDADVATGAAGEAIVASDVMPVLWRIEPGSASATRHELVLDDDGGRDVGFTALAWSPRHGAYFAVSGMHGTLWRIDPLLRRAQRIPTSEALPLGCGTRIGIDRRAGMLCVAAAGKTRLVAFAPDQRYAWVREMRRDNFVSGNL